MALASLASDTYLQGREEPRHRSITEPGDWHDVVRDPQTNYPFPLTNDQRSRGVTSGQLYEYACHEGNYALVNILRGARMAEAAGKKTSSK